MQVRYSYLPQQFENCDDRWEQLKDFVHTGDFTLGKPLQEFEERFARLIGTKHAIGVNSGTDAIKLSLKQKYCVITVWKTGIQLMNLVMCHEWITFRRLFSITV